MPEKKRSVEPTKHPQKKESDPHGQKEYRETDKDALDPHRRDEVKPI